MGLGKFLGGAAAGYMSGAKLKDKMKKEQPAAPISVSIESKPMESMEPMDEYADGGMIGRNRWYGKKPCP